jgi:hypothetical protein
VATLRELRRKADEVFRRVLEEAAAGDPDFAQKAAGIIGPREVARLDGWREPDAQTKYLSDRAIASARSHVRRGADQLGLTSVYTGFASHREARLELSEGAAPDFAPLLATCLDAVLFNALAHVVAHVHSPLTRGHGPRKGRQERWVDDELVPFDLYAGEGGRALMERANGFLLTEIYLWSLAGDGDWEGVVPYAVRYEAARYLWSPRIAGWAFCLRCGEPIHYRRAARSALGAEVRSAPVCAACIRGGSLDWPAHAIAPEARGTWWLRCLAAGCTNAFIGRAQARRCSVCRTSSRAVSKRTPLVPMAKRSEA